VGGLTWVLRQYPFVDLTGLCWGGDGFRVLFSCGGADEALGDCHRDIHVVVQADMHMVMNTGVLAVRASTWALQFLDEVSHDARLVDMTCHADD